MVFIFQELNGYQMSNLYCVFQSHCVQHFKRAQPNILVSKEPFFGCSLERQFKLICCALWNSTAFIFELQIEFVSLSEVFSFDSLKFLLRHWRHLRHWNNQLKTMVMRIPANNKLAKLSAANNRDLKWTPKRKKKKKNKKTTTTTVIITLVAKFLPFG